MIRYIKVIFFLGFIFSNISLSFGQSQIYPIYDETNIRLEKALFDQDQFFSNIKPFDKSLIYDSINNNLNFNSLGGTLDRLLNKSPIYKTDTNNNFSINPIISIAPKYGIDASKIYNNCSLGLSLSGSIGEKFGFQLNGIYGIKSYPKELELQLDSIGTLPHIGKYISKNGENFSYALFTGYFSYSPYKFLNFNLGHGKQFWGDGYRSLFLSDNSAPYPYLKTTVAIWKLKYLWLLGTLFDRNPDFGDDKLRAKFLVSHLLSYNATSWINITFFESVISNPTDSVGIFHLNPGYLNPVIFLRPVEFSSGSTDNTIMGLSIKLKLLKKYQFYGQFTLDEFIISEIKSGNGWWGNKFGYQAGLKVFNLFGIPNLFSRLEFNQVRPYTYSYYNGFSNYGNRFQPLAHPMGANFSEIILESHYHRKRFSVHICAIIGDMGTDIDSLSYGQDIYKPSVSRIGDYDNKQGQGLKSRYVDIKMKAAWLINHQMNLSIFAKCQYQKYPGYNGLFEDTFISFGISSLLFNIEPDVM